MDKKQKVIVIGGVCASISVITVIVLLRNHYKRTEPELSKDEYRELEYDEYIRPTGYKSKTFNVVQSHEEMRERTTRERFRMAGEDDRNFKNEKERKEEFEEQELLEEAEPINDYEEYEHPTGYKSERFNVFQVR